MLTKIARFEIRYLFRNPLLWVSATAIFTVFLLASSVDGFDLGSEGGLLKNGTRAVIGDYVIASLLFMFVSTSFVANVVLRDDETGFGPIVRSTRITKFEYLIGRFLGAFTVAAICMLLVSLSIWLGPLMPWANAAQHGPVRLDAHLYGYFAFALPNLLIHSAIFFALATITRSMMATYLGVIGLMSGFFLLQDALPRPQLDTTIAIAEPFASRALRDATRYWSLIEKNTMLPSLSGALLLNRLVWIGAAILFLAITYAVFRFADQTSKKRRGVGVSREEAIAFSASTASLPSPTHGATALRALLWMRMRFEAKQVVRHPAFLVLMAWGLSTTIFVLLTQRYPDFLPIYPTTLSLIPKIEETFRVVLMVVAVFYASQVVWRERERRVHELVDAAPLPNWAYVIPKTLALALVLVSILVVNAIAAIVLQLSLGFTDVELGKYVLWYVLPTAFDALLLAALAIFVQSLSPHKVAGWGLMTVFLMWREQNQFSRFINHNLLNFGETPRVPLSDLNGAGSFWIGAWTLRLYWGAFAVLLLIVAHLLWRRGTEVRLMPRVALAGRRVRGATGVVIAATLLTFIGTGAYAYYNTNILNEYRTRATDEASIAEYEKRFGKYIGVPQPSLDELTLDIAIHPKQRRVVTKGRFLLRNRTAAPISDLHVRLLPGEELHWKSVNVPGARLIAADAQYDYRIYRLDRAMQPGEQRVLTFETERWHRGFRNRAPLTDIVENGTFLTEGQLMPVLGMSEAGFHRDPDIRRKYGLSGLAEPPKLEDVSATYKHSFGNAWMQKSDITLSTDADQTPIAPGKKISDTTRDGRRTARFVITAPIRPRFSIQSARYAEKHRGYHGVDFAVYYHPRHAWNVERMLDAMTTSLDYYQANFGPYQFDHFRVVEFPGYQTYAQAFAGTIPFAESVGFTADYGKADTIDYVTGITAHEFAHQWWPNQMIAAEMEGYPVFVETLAQYSADMVMKKLHGEDQIRRFLKFELDRYLQGRAWEKEEPPLARVLGENHISYRKGAMVMCLLQKRLGEDAVNRALRNLLAQHKFKDTPYVRTLDLIAALRAEAHTAEEQALITDLFERITIYDLRVESPAASRRADGKWDVTVPIDAKKAYFDSHGEGADTPLNEHIEVGLFTAEPGGGAFAASNVMLMERRPIHSGRQMLHFVTNSKPAFAGVDPYNYYIDRDSSDNVTAVR